MKKAGKLFKAMRGIALVALMAMAAFALVGCPTDIDPGPKSPSGRSGKTADGHDVIVMDANMVASRMEPIGDGETLTFKDLGAKFMPVPGDIICSMPSAAAPYGFLYKVKTVETDGRDTVIETEMASIEEAVEDAEVSETFDLAFDQAEARLYNGVRIVRNQEIDPARAVSLGEPLIIDVGQTIKGVTLEGSVELSSKLNFDIDIKKWKLQYFELSTQPSLKADITVILDSLTGSLEKEVTIPIADFKLLAIRFPIGVVPVVINPSIEIELIITMEGKVEVSAKLIELDYSFKFGIRQEDKYSDLKPFSENAGKPGEYLKNPQISMSGELKVQPKVALMFALYGKFEKAFSAKAGVSASVYTKLAGEAEATISENTSADASLTLSVGLELAVELYLKILKKEIADLSLTFFEREWELWKLIWLSDVGFPPTILTTTLPGGTVGEDYGTRVLRASGTKPFTWTVMQGPPFPPGLRLDSTKGEISGTPTMAGTWKFTVIVTSQKNGGRDTKDFTIVVSPGVPAITTASLPDGTVGTAYNQTLAASGGAITWSRSGSLPKGLSLNAATGAITGTPTAVGTSTFTVKATNSAGNHSKALSITIVAAGSGGAHSHQWGAWQSSATQHWKKCSGCDEENGRANHSGNPCTVCGYSSGTPGSGDNPTNWTVVADSTFGTSDIYAVAYGNNRFVAVGSDSSGSAKIAYSTNGTSWTPVTTTAFGTSGTQDVAYGNNRFVAVGGNKIAYSTNGTSWTTVANSGFSDYSGIRIRSIAYGNNMFIASGNDIQGNLSVDKIAYSSDGINWTAVTTNAFGGRSIGAIAYGNKMFVAVAEQRMAYSPDGTSWTVVTNSTFGMSSISAIAYGNGRFVAGGRNGKMAYSSDGESWAAVTNTAFNNDIRAIAYGNNRFVATGNDCAIAFSSDGVTWTSISDISGRDWGGGTWWGAAYGGGRFVVVGSSGKMAYCDW